MNYLVGTTVWLTIQFPEVDVGGVSTQLDPTEPVLVVEGKETDLTPYSTGTGKYHVPVIIPEGIGAMTVEVKGKLDGWPVRYVDKIPRAQGG